MTRLRQGNRNAILARMVLGIFSSALFVAFPTHGADKSGVSPNTISLPKGPGSIEGLGESFQPTLNTGTAKYSIALKVPPGTAGQTPSLALVYESGGGNGILGFGWQLPVASIQRRTDKGIPLYEGEPPPTSTDDWSQRYNSFINELKEELVPQANGDFFCKNEGPFVRYRRSGDAWQGTTPDGTRMDFGVTPGSRITGGTNKSFCWMIERETDTRGNSIVYSYTNFPGHENTNQVYLSEIRYGPGAPPWNDFHFVRFEYEDRRDWFEDCRSGFVVRTGKRLKRIVIGTQGPTLRAHAAGDFNKDGFPDYLVRRYDLEYLDYAGRNTHWSLLASVTPVGADGVSTLPSSTFGYSLCNPPEQISAANGVVLSLNEPTAVMDNPLVDLLDLNGDGLPDILRTFQGGAVPNRGYLNQGMVSTNGGSVIQWSPGIDLGGDARANGYALSSNAVHLADMNGDGLADLVANSLNNTVYYFSNRADLRWGTRQTMSTQDTAPPSPFGNAEVRTADIDFDKRIDIIQAVSSGGGVDYRVWFNLGQNHYSQRRTVSSDSGYLFSQSGVQIADLNGDRVPDIARIGLNSVSVTPGLGYGRFGAVFNIVIPEGLDAFHRDAAQLQDITGDGLADLVIERAVPGALHYWINLGNYQFSSRKIITGLPSAIGANAVIRWADLDGNGSTDLVYAESAAPNRLRMVDLGKLLTCGTSPNMLTAISNGIGRVTLIGYAPSTQFALEDAAAGQPWTNVVPFPVQVVACVTNLDSLGHSYLTKFRYHDGYYDSVEKQFRGFARVEQVDVGDVSAPTLVTRSHFDTGRSFEVMKGKLLRLTAETENGVVFKDDFTAWQLPPRVLMTGTNGQPVHYTHPTSTTNILKELGQGTERRLESEMVFDDFGNQTVDVDYGVVENGDRSAFDDERTSVTEFAINTNAWILRTPKRTEIRDGQGAAISRTDLFYDDETFSGKNWGIVTIGNLTLKRDWISPSNSTSTISTARTKYDSHGNPITILDPLAAASGGSLDLSKGHAREIVYDGRFHTYPITETIHLGSGKAPLIFQASYDEGFGTVAASTDFNANTTTYAYDTFARLTSIVKPGDTLAYPTVEYDYALAVPFAATSVVNFVETRQLDKTPGTTGGKRDHYLLSRQFVDGLGRKLITKQEAEPASGSYTPRVVVTEAVHFNARQKPVRVLNPFFSLFNGSLDDLLSFENIEAPGWQGQFHSEGSLVTLNLASAHASSTVFDAMLRPVQNTNPDGTTRRTVYEPLVTRSFDENDNDSTSPYHDTPMVHANDGLGRLVRVEEISRLNDDGTPAGTLKTWTTLYQYDLHDQLTRIIDSQNNVKTFGYDGLKRKTAMDDPDRGVMRFVYDDASNLTETTDAKSQRITYTYDGANRIRSEKYHDGLSPPAWRSSGEALTNSVVYHYDEPFPNLPQGDNTIATAQNVKGALAWVEDLSGEEHSSYDSRGRVEWVAKRIPDPLVTPHSSLVTYRTGFAYDSLDRLTNLTYPDADQIRYEYNDRNLLQRIPGGFIAGQAQPGNILSNLLYLPSGQMSQIDYGNGVRTTYAYDSRLRLNKLLTVGRDSVEPASPKELIHFAYDFDGVSNIRSIEDRRPGTVVAAGDPRRNTQIFRYDDVYRLTRVQYSFALPGAASRNDGEINYRYDRIGNMLAQTSTMNHQEKGLPVANLGQMDSGGSAGRWNRTGRAANDQPGPHALTEIRSQESGVRSYPYDPNGNMTNIDGLVCTWDFKDRLVAVENAEMRAAYSYDYTDRRITKRVIPKLVGTSSTSSQTNSVRDAVEHVPTTVSYINKYFEVREHDAPTKYVWNGNTRVARVTGSLNTNIRVQRLRVHPGWNLCSLAVSSPSPLWGEGRGEVLSAAFRWNPVNLGWEPVASNASLPAGTVLWLQATTNASLTITGTYADPTNRTVNAGGDFLPSAGLEALPLLGERAEVRADVLLSMFDSATKHWLSWLPPPLKLSSDLPAFLAPGEAVLARADAPAQLEVPDAALRIRYYHQDHLGSSAILSDGQGRTLEETQFYPFGIARYEVSLFIKPEAYGFVQKEYDEHSRLHYFEARYISSCIDRFCSVDPAAVEFKPEWISDPRRQNAYAYCANNPITRLDSNGRDFYLFVQKGGPGHLGIAVDRTTKLPNGKVTKEIVLYSYGMAGWEGMDFSKGKKGQTIGNILKSLGSAKAFVFSASKKSTKKLGADEVLQFKSDKETDDKLHEFFKGQFTDEKVVHRGKEYTRAKQNYNTLLYNCSDFVEEGLEAVIPGFTGTGKVKPIKSFDWLKEHQQELQSKISESEKSRSLDGKLP